MDLTGGSAFRPNYYFSCSHAFSNHFWKSVCVEFKTCLAQQTFAAVLFCCMKNPPVAAIKDVQDFRIGRQAKHLQYIKWPEVSFSFYCALSLFSFSDLGHALCLPICSLSLLALTVGLEKVWNPTSGAFHSELGSSCRVSPWLQLPFTPKQPVGISPDFLTRYLMNACNISFYTVSVSSLN